MRDDVAGQDAAPVDRAGRRLAAGLLVSLLAHAIILLLQFGVPALGLPGVIEPISVRLAGVPVPTPPAVPVPPAPVAEPAPPAPAPARAAAGMRLVDPVPQPAPAPPPAPVKAKPAVKKDKPRQARRISPPLPSREPLEMDTRVIAQDAVLNDFNVPVARPEEAEQKTIDLKEAQHGTDEGMEASSAAAEAEAARVAQIAEEQRKEEETARKAAQEAKASEARQLAAEQTRRQEEAAKAEQERAQEMAAQQQLARDTEVRRQADEQQRQQLQRQSELAARQQAEQARAEQQKAEQLRVEQQRAEQLAAQQRAEQLAAQQKAAELAAARQAAQQAAAQQAARQAAQQAAQRQAALERDKAAGEALAGNGAPGGTPAGAGRTGGKAASPKDLLGSPLANRARDLVKGLDVLKGTPPPGMGGDRRVAVGNAERDLPLRMYVESWRQKIERNGSINYPRSWADMDRTDALVNVAVRSDGSIEDVTILRSSGNGEMDEAIKRIARVNARYSAFPANIASRYDVIDIRRVWRFDEALKLMEEVP